jgi:hypothetical protein
MLNPMFRDPEIEKIEARIVQRRHHLTRATHESGQRAMKALASPGALIGAAVVGFLAGGGFGPGKKAAVDARSGRRRNDPAARAVKRTGVAGALATGAMWLVRAKFGSPAGLAQYLVSLSRRRQATSARHSYR